MARVDLAMTLQANKRPKACMSGRQPTSTRVMARTTPTEWSDNPAEPGGTLMPGKRVHFDLATWQAIDLLARDRMMDFQELAEAFATCLKRMAGQRI
jgi:hypothetical protein